MGFLALNATLRDLSNLATITSNVGTYIDTVRVGVTA
jgi:hypothetical protein